MPRSRSRSRHADMALPREHIDWTRLSDRDHIELVGRVYVATLPASPWPNRPVRRAVVTWSGHNAVQAQRWLDERARASTRVR